MCSLHFFPLWDTKHFFTAGVGGGGSGVRGEIWKVQKVQGLTVGCFFRSDRCTSCCQGHRTCCLLYALIYNNIFLCDSMCYIYSICYENVISRKVLRCLIHAWFIVKDSPPTDFSCMIFWINVSLSWCYWEQFTDYSLSLSILNYCCATHVLWVPVCYCSCQKTRMTCGKPSDLSRQHVIWQRYSEKMCCRWLIIVNREV